MSNSEFSIADHFEDLDPVEIKYEGSKFTGTIRRFCTTRPKVKVDYEIEGVDGKTKLLTTKVDLKAISPVQPDDPPNTRFTLNAAVDAKWHGAWREGIITNIYPDNQFVVLLKFENKMRTFRPSELRVHREWASGHWSPPFPIRFGLPDVVDVDDDHEERPTSPDVLMQEVALPVERPSPRGNIDGQGAMVVHVPVAAPRNTMQAQFTFRPGQPIEVAIPEEGFEGSWYLATVVQSSDDGHFLVKYEKLVEWVNGVCQKLEEMVHGMHIRPRPPIVIHTADFEKSDSIEAFSKDGWWFGHISRVLGNKKYIVYFSNTKERTEYDHSELRVVHEWKDGQWVEMI